MIICTIYIYASFGEKNRSWKWYFSFAPLRSKHFSQKSSTVFREWIMNFRCFHFLRRILHFSANFWWFFSGFRAKFQKIETCVPFSIKFAKANQKFAENFEFCENYSLFFKIIHFTPYLWPQFTNIFGIMFISCFRLPRPGDPSPRRSGPGSWGGRGWMSSRSSPRSRCADY